MTKADKEGQRKTPILRFKGFTDDWEQRKLNEATTRILRKNKNLISKRPLTISAQYGLIDQQAFFNKQVASSNLENYLLLEKGEFAYNKSYSDGFPYGTIKKLNLYDNGAVSTLYIAFKANADINSDFLENLFSSNKWNNEVYKIAAEGARNHGLLNISPDDFFNIKITISKDSQEQAFISKFLRVFDNLLALYDRKLKLLSQVKKYLLDNLFAEKEYPNLRFKGFTDAWEQRKLGKVATFINGRAYKQNELLDSGKYKVLRVGNFYTNDSWYYSNLELADKYYIDKGDLVYTWSATFGPHIWNGEKVIYHYHIWKIELSKFLDRDFILQILEADKAKLLANTNGSTMIHVTKKDMESKVISLPTIEEQKQIGLYLTKFDTLIALYENKKQNLIAIKKNLLNTMFI